MSRAAVLPLSQMPGNHPLLYRVGAIIRVKATWGAHLRVWYMSTCRSEVPTTMWVVLADSV